MSSILVTGGAGFVGSHACKALKQAGITPVTFDNLTTGRRELVRWGPLVVGDLHDTALVRWAIKTHGCTAVVHFAASAYVGESVTNPRKYVRNNVVATSSLLEAVLDEGVRTIVFSSTCAVYGVPTELPIRESTPLAPINPYGASKRFIEEILATYEKAYGLRWMALRYFNAAGCDPDAETGEIHDPETHLIPLVIDAGLGRGPAITVFGTDYDTPDGTAVRDYIHVSDLADAHVLALKHLQSGGASGAVNLGTGNGSSVLEIINAVERHLGTKVPRQLAARREGDPANLVADAGYAQRLLGWIPNHSTIEEIVETATRWRRR
jgi:UDP-glucose-4-epimerase GalE